VDAETLLRWFVRHQRLAWTIWLAVVGALYLLAWRASALLSS
jgi:hypothetical protein